MMLQLVETTDGYRYIYQLPKYKFSGMDLYVLFQDEAREFLTDQLEVDWFKVVRESTRRPFTISTEIARLLIKLSNDPSPEELRSHYHLFTLSHDPSGKFRAELADETVSTK